MKRISIWLVLGGMVCSGCSTVDRRVYFAPVGEAPQVSGPQRLACGWTQQAGKPDRFQFLHNGTTIYVSADQRIRPYLWGPWFASVVPVFPITWAAEGMIKNDLEIQVEVKKSSMTSASPLTFSVMTHEGAPTAPSTITGSEDAVVTFPVDFSRIREFTLSIHSADRSLNLSISFTKTKRWAWTQWTPNC